MDTKHRIENYFELAHERNLGHIDKGKMSNSAQELQKLYEDHPLVLFNVVNLVNDRHFCEREAPLCILIRCLKLDAILRNEIDSVFLCDCIGLFRGRPSVNNFEMIQICKQQVVDLQRPKLLKPEFVTNAEENAPYHFVHQSLESYTQVFFRALFNVLETCHPE